RVGAADRLNDGLPATSLFGRLRNQMKLIDRFRKLKPSPRDYLYVDEIRLNCYIDQIGSTSAFRRSPSLKFGISDSGPNVSVEFATQVHEKTTHEKVSELVKYLEDNAHISHTRPALVQESGDYVKIPDFVIEECDACRILIPSTGDPYGRAGIVIWVSEWPLERDLNLLRPAGLLCLIQDSTHDDTKYTAGFSHSGYTWLQTLLYQLSQDNIKTKMSMEYPLTPVGDYQYDIMAAQIHLHKEMQVFRPYPLRWLKEKGCILSTSRRIVTLYRIRNVGGDEIGTENRQEDFTVSTFAYAIAIWAGPN
ncbi:MAG: hypothetical protein L7F78_22345, partial [Syntrophales bacterium LBB04]|nr:hypothetical protein [Syntrophales bacterium LBB04]